MWDFFQKLFASDFMPHGHCYFWTPGIVWLHVISDAFVVLAYYSIPITLVYFTRKRTDLPYRWMFVAFSAFILACGTTHLMEIWSVWHGTYRLSGVIKAITAVLSVSTALLLIKFIPAMLTLRSPTELARVNLDLEREIRQRTLSEESLRRIRDELEIRVQERTADLAAINTALKEEITVRQRGEAKLLASLSEKEILIKEVHHRVKNNLQIVSSLLNLQWANAKDPTLLAALRDNQSRIQSMALVHEHLYLSKNLAELDFAAFVHALVNSLFQSLRSPGAPVTLKLDMEPVLIGVHTAIPCALIINELVTNALKHAFPRQHDGQIRIALHPAPDGRTQLTIQDNGVGLPPTVDLHRTSSLGLQLVTSLTSQIKGTLEVTREAGTRFTIFFPPHHPHSKD